MASQNSPDANDTVRVLQAQQAHAYDALYDTFNRVLERVGIYRKEGYDQVHASPEYQQALKAYNDTVTALVAELGPLANCSAVDIDRWGTYSDCYKSDHGFRPGHATLAEVNAYLQAR